MTFWRFQLFYFTNTRPSAIFWEVHAFTQPSTARSIFVDNLRGVDLEGGNALASSGGFVMPNFFFQAILVTAVLRYPVYYPVLYAENSTLNMEAFEKLKVVSGYL